ncbi:MAG: hypothetical protein ABS36_14910 [Acidobacteria bacterium SCN 69-37]|nr:MAG: hypothetical protein ABS36_14910 [Acidobacteria bacterium SCN 69-37]
MAQREDILREKTYKGDAETVYQRVYYTITEPRTGPASSADDHMRRHRMSVAVARLFERLHEKGVISSEDLDDILFEVVM